MKEKGITLQAAITQATNNAKECLRVFVELSSSGQTAALSDDERRYVQVSETAWSAGLIGSTKLRNILQRMERR